MTQIPQIMWMNMPKVIHSLQLHILHQMRSYSCQDDLTIELYLLFCVYTQLGIRVILGKRVQIPLNQVQSDTKRNSKSSTPYFTSNETLCQWLRSLWVELYLFHRYSGIGAIWGNLAQIHQIMPRDTGKVNQGLPLHIPHQISFYSSIQDL